MVQIGPLVGGLSSIVTAVVFLFVGRILSRRRLGGEDRLANEFFVLWWYSLAGLSLAVGALNVAGAWSLTDLALHTVLLLAILVVLCAALWGLAYYLVYLYTGARKWLVPLGAFYSFYALLLLYLVVVADPVRVVLDRWGTRIEYANPDVFDDHLLVQALLLLFAVPQLAAALAYMSLILKVHVATQQYRIAMVASSIVLWFGSGLAAGIGGFNDAVWWVPASRFVSVVASLGILFAYRPPRRVLAWLAAHERPQAGQEVTADE